jgi:hypothetical protein
MQKKHLRMFGSKAFPASEQAGDSETLAEQNLSKQFYQRWHEKKNAPSNTSMMRYPGPTNQTLTPMLLTCLSIITIQLSPG